MEWKSRWLLMMAMALLAAIGALGQAPAARKAAPRPNVTSPLPPGYARPKLVVLLVVDQMRADYVDKFQDQWNGGLKRLLQEGAWFREAAYPYAVTETCAGHATISTGSLPATHGMIGNAWWDRESRKMVTCTADPNTKNSAYAGGTAKGGDSAWRMRMPSFAEELKFQTGSGTRVVTFSLKARAAITMAGHQGDAVTWFDGGSWVTSSTYGTAPFVEEFVKAHPLKADYGKSWELSLPKTAYRYEEKANGAALPAGAELTFPHALKGQASGNEPDDAFYQQWVASPFADTYLTKMAVNAVDRLGLGSSGRTDFLAVSYSSVDYVGHAFGPRSWEIQDILIRLDEDLADLFSHLDAKVGRGNYIVALSADHGVGPIPQDMQSTGADAGVLHVQEVQERMEKALEPFNYKKPAVARITNTGVYFSSGIYDRLKTDALAMRAVLDAIRTEPGIAGVYRAEELQDWPDTHSPMRSAEAASYFPGRSGDLLLVPKPYWVISGLPAGKGRDHGAGHGTPYGYDQRVAALLMGWGIEPGTYFGRISPADIAPTLAALCGITLSSNDGRVLAEALMK
jgi:predicted AlkP superfamily pyrophosphatase or phosphodiesterase